MLTDMKNKKLFKTVAIFIATVSLMAGVVRADALPSAPYIDGQVSCIREEIYPGVIATEYYLEEGYTYSENGPQWFRTIEFDPKQEDLAFDVVMAGDHLGALKKTTDIVSDFNKTNTENKKVIAAVNGDLWMMAQYHSRVEGSGTVFNGCSDAVVKKELTIPRGTNIVDGEIICGPNIQQETPWEETFQSFGITPDGTPLIGNIAVRLTVRNTDLGVKANADGFNRLPANNALIVYSDKGPLSNYCLDDAYEVVVDCDYDYTFRAGETITGKVTEISKPGDERPMMKENRIILTARGSKLDTISSYSVGDTVTVAVRITDYYGNADQWSTVTEAVGGHVVALKDGQSFATSVYRYDPMTLIGYKDNGNVVMIVNDGRQEGYSIGIVRGLYDELALELGMSWVFMLDGGGSTTLVELTENGYELKNRPSDMVLWMNVERAVDNAVLLSYISDEPITPPEPPEPPVPQYTVGDINADGDVTSIDANLLKKHISGTLQLVDTALLAADVNCDEDVTSIDANFMTKYLAGSITSFDNVK